MTEQQMLQTLGFGGSAEELIGKKFRATSGNKIFIGSVEGVDFGGISSWTLCTGVGNFYLLNKTWARESDPTPVTFTDWY